MPVYVTHTRYVPQMFNMGKMKLQNVKQKKLPGRTQKKLKKLKNELKAAASKRYLSLAQHCSREAGEALQDLEKS